MPSSESTLAQATIDERERLLTPERRATYTCLVTTETVIRRVEPRDGPLVKSLRLRALGTDPTSFASTRGREAAYTDDEWNAWAAGDATGDEMATMIAFRGAEPVGIVAAYRDDAEVRLYHVIAMWAAPESRGRGLGRQLLQATPCRGAPAAPAASPHSQR